MIESIVTPETFESSQTRSGMSHTEANAMSLGSAYRLPPVNVNGPDAVWPVMVHDWFSEPGWYASSTAWWFRISS